MKNWLLEEEEKIKVGRPKLAREPLLKKSRIMVLCSMIAVIVLLFSFVSYARGQNPLFELYRITVGKITGPIKNNHGFNVDTYYNKKDDYVLKVKIPDKVNDFSGDYVYTTYYLKNGNWREHSSKKINNGTKSFKILINSKKNENTTWKVKLQIVNAGVNLENYAPTNWRFNQSDKVENMYAYKVFTVKGFYSPVTLEEEKESIKNKDSKVYVQTKKGQPRTFILNVPEDNKYSAKISYTDASDSKVFLKKKNNLENTSKFFVPELNRTSKVIIRVWVDGYDEEMLKDIKLSNWKIKNDSNSNSYLYGTYLLKPKSAY